MGARIRRLKCWKQSCRCVILTWQDTITCIERLGKVLIPGGGKDKWCKVNRNRGEKGQEYLGPRENRDNSSINEWSVYRRKNQQTFQKDKTWFTRKFDWDRDVKQKWIKIQPARKGWSENGDSDFDLKSGRVNHLTGFSLEEFYEVVSENELLFFFYSSA